MGSTINVTLRRYNGTDWDDLVVATSTEQVNGLATALAAKLDIAGTNAMTGNLDLDGHNIVDVVNVQNTAGAVSLTGTAGVTLAPGSGQIISASGERLRNLHSIDGSSQDTDAATKAYVDGLVSAGLHVVDSVEVAFSADIGPATPATMLSSPTDNYPAPNGAITAAVGQRFLLAGQSTASENGIYEVIASSPYTQKVTADSVAGAFCFVEDGALNDYQYACGNDGTTWSYFSRVDTTVGTNLTRSGNTISVVSSPTFDTQTAGDNTTKAATTAFVTTAISNAATNYQAANPDLASIAAISDGARGLLKKTGDDLYEMDTHTYIEYINRQSKTDDFAYHIAFSNGETAANITAISVDGGGTFTYNPNSQTLSAGNFSGNGSALTSLNASNVSSGTLPLTRGGTGGYDAKTGRGNLYATLIAYDTSNPATAGLNTGDMVLIHA